ncbi:MULTISPECIES: RAD55 family ATPase [Halomicrobium]|uniref:KaiA binding n=2 Tax=Halomicrobium mukohataei TaxID=57705 RepID=C7P1I1_HALMD|nr:MULTISPECIES: ATPase domain-containing protein [Halomicrobium]ACV47189.1 KaiA binding [Halomicrobium mukohataei DSM 12286]MBO4247875.1 KaiA-binding protein [Halomicrobium sp. IBSBa]NLV09395.1 KaiA-binding protein [Halomicrobium mukohataei]QCD65665.1 KaiA-binding protein [Halomicrobium mukohataei]QFR20471.1 KaiA-binding protein [Halomicrobium sp. ZPS1]
MRLESGVPGFDELVEGGLLENRLYVISGPPGSGKTTFSAQFITQGAKRGEDCLYVTMHETKEELMQDMAGYDFGFDRAMQSDAIQFLNLVTESGKRTITQFGSEGGLTSRLVAFIEQNNVERVVVDSTMLLQHFLTDVSEEITGFLSALKQTDATVLLISEMTDPTSYSDEHYLAHGVVFFHNFLDSGSMTRGLQVIKMRGTAIDCDIRRISFSDTGLRVHPSEKVES